MRLIDADAVQRKIKRHIATVIYRGIDFIPSTKNTANHYEFLRGYEEGAKYIANMVLNSDNLVDAEPVKHGRWINRTKSVKGLWDYRFDCSTCGHIFWNAGIKNFNYCPACGAKMDLEET